MFSIDMITDNRLASAKKTDMTPLKIDKASRVAIFAGSGGVMYETTLDNCTCPDFAIQGHAQPCKHMIRLAMELDEIPSTGMLTDLNAAKGKLYLGRAKDFVKCSVNSDFIRFAMAFFTLMYGFEPVDDNVFADSLDAQSVTDLPFFKFDKKGVGTIKKEWKKDCTNLMSSVFARFGEIVMYSAYGNKALEEMIKEGV